MRQTVEARPTLSATEMSSEECSFWQYVIYCEIRRDYEEQMR